MPDRLKVERAAANRARVAATVRLVGDVVARAEVAVEEEHGDRAREREPGDDGADPQCPGVRPEVSCNDVRGGLAGELREVGDTPVVG